MFIQDAYDLADEENPVIIAEGHHRISLVKGVELLENIDAMRDKTVIIVTHRRAALAICDYQLHIENGRMTQTEAASI